MGLRKGRAVRVLVDGQHCLTQVNGSLPAFEVEAQDGKFSLSDNLPEAAHMALKDLRKAKRWRGVRITGGTDGLRVDRQARVLNLWLYDLWLAERLLETKLAIR